MAPCLLYGPGVFFTSVDELPHVTTSDIIKLIGKMNRNCGPGPDGIPAVFVYKCATVLALPLSILFNLSFSEGIVPDNWKTSTVIPVHKGGDRAEIDKYRAISKSPIFCKLAETYIRDFLLDFLNRNDLISLAQHGFLGGRSVTTNLISCKNDWTRNLDAGKNTTVAYIDYSKAFDSVSHPKLLHKLRHEFCVPEHVLRWIASFLDDRKYRVKVGSSFSEIFPVRSGVPQGSVLGPLLFLLYVNALGDRISKSALSTYADDTKIYFSVNDSSDAVSLQNDLDTMYTWSCIWQLDINFLKSCILQIGPEIDVNYELAGNTLSKMSSVRDLGIQVTSNLSDHEHCLIIVRKANFALRNIKLCFFNFNNRKFYLTLYMTYVRPLLESSMQTFSPKNIGDIDLLESVQRQFSRSLMGGRDIPYRDRLLTLSLQPLEIRRIHGDLILLARVINGSTSLEFSQFFQLSTRPSRGHTYKLRTPYARTDTRKYFWCNRVVAPWNALTQESVIRLVGGAHPSALSDFDALPFCRGSWTR